MKSPARRGFPYFFLDLPAFVRLRFALDRA